MTQQDQAPAGQTASAETPKHVVGIGASAGGLEAIEQFFDNMPPDSGLAFVVVQHLSPDYKSLMAELLSKHTSMTVQRVEDGVALEPNTVYLIPPKKNLVVHDRHLVLTDQDRGHGLNLPIDIFLRSLAEEYRENSVGIIFSGTGSDGTRGVRALKEVGGMVMVQDEESAKFDGMPRSAVTTGLIDFVLPPREMPHQLLSYVRHPLAAKKDQDGPVLTGEEDKLSRVISLLRKDSGLDFALYKPSTVVRRIERRMSVNQCDTLSDYLEFLYDHPRELGTLYKELLIGVTKFFRDSQPFRQLRQGILPKILAESDNVRVWVAGSSTGEEAYSVAMALCECMDDLGKKASVQIFATDVDRDAVEFASAGLYPESIAADVSPERLARFFIRRGESYQICQRIREMIVFASHNLIKDPPFTKLDLVCCRNLLIYLQPILQRKVLSTFHFALKPGGYLFLGNSETVGDMASEFADVDAKSRLYRAVATRRRPLLDAVIEPRYSRGADSDRPGARATQAAAPGAEDRALDKLQEKLLADFAPTCLVLDENYELQHSFGAIRQYLGVPHGRRSFNVLRMVPKELSTALSTAMHKVIREGRPVQYSDVKFPGDDGNRRTVNLRVEQFSPGKNQRNLYVVYLQEPEKPSAQDEPGQAFDPGNESAQRITDLEQELQYSRENLQATVEELETSNEELQATNEELLAANEELQSTNEELQSVNEELYTVNSEYQTKIGELTELNDDMENLLRSTRIGTLFLDRDLNIRKFTPDAARFVNVMEHDVGRPLSHISQVSDDVDLLADARKVLETLQPVERELNLSGGVTLLRVLPYRTQRDEVRGVVLAFIDVDRPAFGQD